MVQLDIISDLVCPWCYIGKTLLDRALERHADHPFAIEWHPYLLNPEMPEGGLAYADYLRMKFGDPARSSAMLARVQEAAEAAGAEIRFERIQREPDSTDAHRLVHWAGLEGRQTPVVSALFRAHWRDGRDIGDAATLAAIAGEAGLDAAMVARLLASDADRAEIRARARHSRERGVSGVPTFIVAGQHVVSGAQPVALWEDVIGQIGAALAAGEKRE